MKLKIFHSLLLTALMLPGLFLSSCKKEEGTYNVYFWSMTDTMTTKLELHIAGRNKGPLHYIYNDRYVCEDSLTRSQTLFFPLSYGEYLIQAFDQNEELKYSTTLVLKKKSVDGTSTVGYAEVNGNEDCMTFAVR